MQVDPLNWTRLFMQAGLVVIPVGLLGWVGYRKLWWILTEHRPHTHTEREGVLHATGIRYPRSMNGKP
jgi:hypothetical protein